MSANVIVLTENLNYWNDTLRELNALDRYQVIVRSINDLTLPSSLAEKCIVLLDFDPLKKSAFNQDLVELKSCADALVVITALPDLLPDRIHALKPTAILEKPVKVEDLIELFDQNMRNRSLNTKEESSSREDLTGSWVQDVRTAAQSLAQLSLETSAQAALIAKKGHVWAYAGQLLHTQAEELVDLINTHWVEGSQRDLASYVRLGSNGRDYMLYATSLQPSYILALAFDAQLPFGEIRAQANAFAKKMARVKVMAVPDDHIEEDITVDKNQSPPLPSDWEETRDRSIEHSQAIEDILSALEIPLDPDEEGSQLEKSQIPAGDQDTLPPDVTPQTRRDFSQAVRSRQSQNNRIPLIQLNYCGMLVTRLPEHGINRYLELLLAKWFPKLCLAYGWKFKNLLVEDQSITWVVSTLGKEMPIEMVSIIGTKLSERIFRVFPSYYDENPSGEYWAIPYYLETTNQVPPDELRRLILHQIRQEQGI